MIESAPAICTYRDGGGEVEGGRWEVEGGKWEVEGGRSKVGGGASFASHLGTGTDVALHEEDAHDHGIHRSEHAPDERFDDRSPRAVATARGLGAAHLHLIEQALAHVPAMQEERGVAAVGR